MNSPDQHLSDDQLENLLIGDAEPRAAGHLAACSLCRAKNEAFLAVVAGFNQASLDWACVRAGQEPVLASTRAPSGLPAQRSRLFSAPAYALAAAMLVLFAVIFAGVSHPHAGAIEQSDSSAANLQTPGDSSAALPSAVSSFAATHSGMAGPGADSQIAADNDLLAEIDSALDQPDPAPVDASPLASPFGSDPRSTLSSRFSTRPATRSVTAR